MKKLIIFEGVDGSGKSIVSKRVADITGAYHIDSPTIQFKEVRGYVNQHTPPNGQLLFYMATNIDLSQTFLDLLPKTDVVCSRYYYTTLVDYSTRIGITVEELMQHLPVSHKHFYQPDLTILLYVNDEAQKKRINERNNGLNTHTDILCLDNEVYRKGITERYLDIAKKKDWKIIDTSNIGIEEVVSISLQHIHGVI